MNYGRLDGTSAARVVTVSSSDITSGSVPFLKWREQLSCQAMESRHALYRILGLYDCSCCRQFGSSSRTAWQSHMNIPLPPFLKPLVSSQLLRSWCAFPRPHLTMPGNRHVVHRRADCLGSLSLDDPCRRAAKYTRNTTQLCQPGSYGRAGIVSSACCASHSYSAPSYGLYYLRHMLQVNYWQGRPLHPLL